MTRWANLSKKDAKRLGLEGMRELDKIEKRENKYNNQKPTVDEIKFDSNKEARFYENLKLLKAAGEVKDFELQPKFVLLEKEKDRVTGRGIKYIADFKITYSDGSVEVVDVKGYKTQVYKLKKKLLLAKYPDINFKEV